MEEDQLEQDGGYPYMRLSSRSAYLNGAPLKVYPGTYAFGMLANDYFTDYRYKLGVNYYWVTANDQLVYECQIERMDFLKGRYINTHMDYFLKYRMGLYHVRLFKEDFNAYPYYKQENNGRVAVEHGDTTVVKLYLLDLSGRMDSAHCTLIGDSSGKHLRWNHSFGADTTFRVKAGRNNRLSHGNWEVNIPSAAIYHDFDFKMRAKSQRPKALTPSMQLHYRYTPMTQAHDREYSGSQTRLGIWE